MHAHTHRSTYLFSILVASFYLSTSPVYASMDPQSSTASATATVPSLSVTSDSQAPTPPVLVRPVDDAFTSDNMPEFVWRGSSDPNSNTIIYTLYLNGVATYLGISSLGNSEGPNYISRIDGDEIKLRALSVLADGSYVWRVVASDLSNNEASSATWDLNIDTQAPPLSIIKIDHFEDPIITSESIFDIAGPKDIYFTILSDPSTDIQLTFVDELGGTVVVTGTTSELGLAYPYTHLVPGLYEVTALAIDHAQNTTVLPPFHLRIYTPEVTIPLPPIPGIPESIKYSYAPLSLPSLPATIAIIESRSSLSSILYGSLAIAMLYLPFFAWKRRRNLLLTHIDGTPYSHAIIYHSIPTGYHGSSKLMHTSFEPLSFVLSSRDHGRLFIPHLTRYSTLTFKCGDTLTVLSICATCKQYTITI